MSLSSPSAIVQHVFIILSAARRQSFSGPLASAACQSQAGPSNPTVPRTPHVGQGGRGRGEGVGIGPYSQSNYAHHSGVPAVPTQICKSVKVNSVFVAHGTAAGITIVCSLVVFVVPVVHCLSFLALDYNYLRT